MSTGIIWQDGFDVYKTASDMQMNYNSGGTGVITTTGGRFGGGAWQASSNGVGNIFVFPTALQECWMNIAFSSYNLTDTQERIIFAWGIAGAGSNNGTEACLTFTPSTGLFNFYQGYVGGTVKASKVIQFKSGWHWINVRMKHSNGSGEIEIWLDESQILLATGLVTQTYSANPLTWVSIGDGYGGTTVGAYFDDLFITNTTKGRIPDSRIETLVPNSDAGPNAGTPSTGTSHYAVVDEAQYDTSDFLTMASSGDEENFGSTSMVGTPATVHSVKVYMVAQKSDAGSFSLVPLVVSGGTEGDGAGQNLSTSLCIVGAIFELDPNTSAAWTYANANSATKGFKVA